MINDRDDECPDGCGGYPGRGCNCQDDGEQRRIPRVQWPDADRARRVTRKGKL